VVPTGAVVGLVLLRRRRPADDGPDAAMRAARQAIRGSRQDERRRRHGTMRGKGYGGNDGQATDAGVTSESGGMP
jgi:hypothetical protein